MEKIPCKKFTDHRKEIEARIAGKDYIIYFLSEMKTGKDADRSLLNPEEEILEAHFFDEREYIHLYPYDETLRAAIFSDTGEEDRIDGSYLLRNRDFSELVYRQYVAYDEYGQAYVERVRPVCLRRRKNVR